MVSQDSSKVIVKLVIQMDSKYNKPHFLSIPLEIRLQIYSLLVSTGPDNWSHGNPLFYVCQQVHNEILPIFIQNRFHPFDTLERFVSWRVGSVDAECRGMKLREHVKKISIECSLKDLKSFRKWYEAHKGKTDLSIPAAPELINAERKDAVLTGHWWEHRYLQLVEELSSPTPSLAAKLAAGVERYREDETPEEESTWQVVEFPPPRHWDPISRIPNLLYRKIVPESRRSNDAEGGRTDAEPAFNQHSKIKSPIALTWAALTAFANIQTCWITQRSQPSTISHKPTNPFLVEQRLILEMVSCAWSRSLKNLRVMNGITPLHYLANCTELRSLEFSGYSTTPPDELTTDIFKHLPHFDSLLLQRFSANYDTQEYCVPTRELSKYVSIIPVFITNLPNRLRELKIMHLDQYVRSHFLTIQMIQALKTSHHTDSLQKLVVHDDSLPYIDDDIARVIRELPDCLPQLKQIGLRMVISDALAVEWGIKRKGRQEGEARTGFVSEMVAGDVYIYFDTLLR